MMRIDPLTPGLDSISMTINVDWTTSVLFSPGSGYTAGWSSIGARGRSRRPGQRGGGDVRFRRFAWVNGDSRIQQHHDRRQEMNIGPMVSFNKFGLPGGIAKSYDFAQGTDKISGRLGPISVETANKQNLQGTPKVEIPYGTQDLKNAVGELLRNIFGD